MMVKSVLLCALAVSSVVADIYMHNPRGSNNRNCRNDNNDRRRNGNRLFDSQNNDKGGYSCPRAYPFPAGNNGQAQLNARGDIVGSSNGLHIDTETFSYYEGTKLMVEWTEQHGCGNNENNACRIVIQYMCDTDAPKGSDSYLSSLITNEYVRDGTPITNNSGDNTDDEATTTIPDNVNSNQCDNVNPNNCKLDGRFGYQESHEWYDWCKQRERNYGLFTADQLPISGNNRNRAINTRQNPNGNRNGLECPEERDYYPYWTPTMWKDIAVGVSAAEMSACKAYTQESQNVINKCYCDLSGVNVNGAYANNEDDCAAQNGQWKCKGKWGLSAPSCFEMTYSRDNHLGNTINGYASHYNWTLPSPPEGQDSMRCVLRVRYNSTTADFPQTTDFTSNCNPNDNTCTKSPIIDRNNREDLTYVRFFETDDRYNLSMAVNTNQHARTFQDRSYAFDIKRRSDSLKDTCKKEIVNVNVRGKRGNIVQVYPSVEYDFVPQDLALEAEDCVHMQWIGSDYNPNRNPNNAEGGPPNPNNINEAKADRSNLLQTYSQGENYPLDARKMGSGRAFFSDKDGNRDMSAIRKFAFIEQNINDCDTITTLRGRNPNNRQARERDPRNCAKLNAAKTPYFKGGVQKVYNQGTHKFMSTRNNNFSNRSQKLKINVTPCTYNCAGGDSGLSGGQVAGITIGVLAAVGIAGAIGFTQAKKRGMITGDLRMPWGGAASTTPAAGAPAPSRSAIRPTV